MLGAGGAVVKDVTTYSPITYYVLDNLGEPTKTIQYDGANLSATSSTLGDS